MSTNKSTKIDTYFSNKNKISQWNVDLRREHDSFNCDSSTSIFIATLFIMSWWSISRNVPQPIQNFPDGRRYRRLANTKLVAIILICPAVVWIIVNDNNNTAAVVSSCRIKCLLVSLHQVRHGNHKQTNSRARDNSFAAIQLEFLWQPTPAILVRQQKDKPFENKLQRSLVKKNGETMTHLVPPQKRKKGVRT